MMEEIDSGTGLVKGTEAGGQPRPGAPAQFARRFVDLSAARAIGTGRGFKKPVNSDAMLKTDQSELGQ